MRPQQAVAIVNGSLPWKDAREYLEACLYIATHSSCREYVSVFVLTAAVHMADYAVDHGEEAAVRLINQTRAEMNNAHQ